jgi:transposase InsO family protein
VLEILGVSKSGFYAWKKRIPSKQKQRKAKIKKKIIEIYKNSIQNYGAPKITANLLQAGEVIAEKTVGNYMGQMGIRAQWVHPFTPTKRNSDLSDQLHNILNQELNPSRPNAVWCSDITYIWTSEGFVYLTSIMDLFSRKIIAWTLTKTMEVSCVVNTVYKALDRRNSDTPILIHSDRGSQYVAAAYEEVTQKM